MPRTLNHLLPGIFAVNMLGCADRPPITPSAPGAPHVRVTRNPAEFASCAAVGNIDGSHVRRGMYANVTTDQIAIPQLQNQAIGLGGNTIFDTSSAYTLSGITLDAEYAVGDPAYDGTAELWFDSVQDKDAFFSDPDYLASVAPDERVFADMEQTRFLLCREEQVI